MNDLQPFAEQLARIESKLDALISALSAEDEDIVQTSAQSLDGERLGAERNPWVEL